MFQTPVLFLIFNRLETTKLVFEAIRKIQPFYLYIAADGPRGHIKGESKTTEQVRKFVMDNIDWDCEVKTLFRSENLGCGLAVSQAITWFFEDVEEGIILEDDTLPNVGFFKFCEELLRVYKNSNEVGLISGTNYLFNKFEYKDSYYFSSLTAIWGWATWKNTWQSYQDGKSKIQTVNGDLIRDRFKNKHYAAHFYKMLMDSVDNKIDTWDLQFSYFLIQSKLVSIVPVYNQITNIGFIGTHTFMRERSIFMNMETKNLELKRSIQKIDINVNIKLDRIALKNIEKGDNLNPSFFRRLLNKIKALL